jgi:hypothetical protein
MQAEGGQFTVRGLFALVAGCAILALLLRYSTASVPSVVAGFGLGAVFALGFVGVAAMFDAIERRAQFRFARKLEAEAIPAAVVHPIDPTPPSSA